MATITACLSGPHESTLFPALNDDYRQITILFVCFSHYWFVGCNWKTRNEIFNIDLLCYIGYALKYIISLHTYVECEELPTKHNFEVFRLNFLNINLLTSKYTIFYILFKHTYSHKNNLLYTNYTISLNNEILHTIDASDCYWSLPF